MLWELFWDGPLYRQIIITFLAVGLVEDFFLAVLILCVVDNDAPADRLDDTLVEVLDTFVLDLVEVEELFFGVVDFVDVVIVEDVFADVDDGEGVVDEDTADDVVDDDRADDTVILVEDVDVGVVDNVEDDDVVVDVIVDVLVDVIVVDVGVVVTVVVDGVVVVQALIS